MKIPKISVPVKRVTKKVTDGIVKGIQERCDEYVTTKQSLARLKLSDTLTHMEEARVMVKLADKNEARWLAAHPIQRFLLNTLNKIGK